MKSINNVMIRGIFVIMLINVIAMIIVLTLFSNEFWPATILISTISLVGVQALVRMLIAYRKYQNIFSE